MISGNHATPRESFHDILAYGSRIPIIRGILAKGSRIPVFREILTILYRQTRRNDPWSRRHPFDVSYGTKTNGYLPPWLMGSGDAAEVHVTAYSGCQPSCLRQALTRIPQPEDKTFVDFGCGKGRAIIVATEFPFRRILGIELAPKLAADAHRNVQIIRKRFPKRTKIDIVQGDAMAVPLPDGNLVIFVFHPFGAEVFARMLARISDAVRGSDREIFLVYENPVYDKMVDAVENAIPCYRKIVPCAVSEVGFMPGDGDEVAIWRIGRQIFCPKCYSDD
jgi:SAM-dependent methyltransferase